MGYFDRLLRGSQDNNNNNDAHHHRHHHNYNHRRNHNIKYLLDKYGFQNTRNKICHKIMRQEGRMICFILKYCKQIYQLNIDVI